MRKELQSQIDRPGSPMSPMEETSPDGPVIMLQPAVEDDSTDQQQYQLMHIDVRLSFLI